MIVETKNGKVRGFEDESVAGGKKYFSYLGIPYAKPPIGDLRFSVSKHLSVMHLHLHLTSN